MKARLFIILFILVPIANGQVVVDKEQLVRSLDGQSAYHPVFSPNGKQLLFSSDNYTGLYLYDIESQSVKNVSKEPGAGLSPVFSKDGNTVYYKRISSSNKRRYSVWVSCDLTTQQTKEIGEPARDQETVNRMLLEALPAEQASDLYVCIENLKIVLYQDGQRMEMEPAGAESGYIWASLSPDKERILFTASSKGTFISDLSGKIIASFGNLHAPVWYDDNYIVGTNSQDNGEVITSSQIVMASVDGKWTQALTSSDGIALYPAASSMGKRIAYSTDKGELYLLEISIND